MQFDIIDHNVSDTTNVFLIIANIINLFYNIPQMYKTYTRKSTKDLSGWFLLLRIIGNSIWIEYAIELNSMLMLINNIVTVLSSLFIGYYKLLELIHDYKQKKQSQIYPIILENININKDDNIKENDNITEKENDKEKLIENN
jgi:uncharacterized protein with PQ loop repeat